MRRDTVFRVVLFGVLTVSLFAMFVHYGAIADGEGHDRTQVSQRQLQTYEQHLGEQIFFWGTVVTVDTDSFAVRSAGEELTVAGHAADVEPGDTVQVFGTTKAERTIRAERVVVSESTNVRYLYVISALGFLIALGAFLRDWEVQWHSLRVAPREDDDG